MLTDSELIESLRLWNRDDAADRIEQLVATNEALTKERDEQIEWVKRLADDLIAAEAKLAKAVVALEYYAGRVTYRLCDDCPVQVHKSADLSGPARATLAEITSGVATTPYGLEGESR